MTLELTKEDGMDLGAALMALETLLGVRLGDREVQQKRKTLEAIKERLFVKLLIASKEEAAAAGLLG